MSIGFKEIMIIFAILSSILLIVIPAKINPLLAYLLSLAGLVSADLFFFGLIFKALLPAKIATIALAVIDSVLIIIIIFEQIKNRR